MNNVMCRMLSKTIRQFSRTLARTSAPSRCMASVPGLRWNKNGTGITEEDKANFERGKCDHMPRISPIATMGPLFDKFESDAISQSSASHCSLLHSCACLLDGFLVFEDWINHEDCDEMKNQVRPRHSFSIKTRANYQPGFAPMMPFWS